MKIIITMAGKGSRFKRAGYTCPKHEIIAGTRSLFSWSMSSLENFFDDEFFFIVREGTYSKKKIEQELLELGIKKYQFIVLSEETDGQAATVMEMAPFMEPEDSFLVFNIDTAIQPQFLNRHEIIRSAGTIPIFYDEGTHWSFVRLDTNQGIITEVVEKVPISNWASIGMYYFRQWSDYQAAYYKMKKEIKERYGEVYIAPLYNELIAQGKEIKPVFLPDKSFAVLGTPEELTFFEDNTIASF